MCFGAIIFYATAWALLWCAWQLHARAAAGPRWQQALSSRLDAEDEGERSAVQGSLTAAQHGARDELAGERLQAAIRRWLYSLMVPRQDREDLAQDATESALASLGSYDPERGTIDRWFNRIAVHTAAHYHAKAHRRREAHRNRLPEDGDVRALFDERIEREERRRALHTALLEVPPDARAVVVAHDIEEETMKEIADRIGAPLSTVYKRHARGLALLAAALQAQRR